MLLLSTVPFVCTLLSLTLGASAAVAPAPGALNIDTPTPENAGYEVYIKSHHGQPMHPVPRALHQGQPMHPVNGIQPPVPRLIHQGQPMRPVKGPQPPVPRQPSPLLHHSQPMHPVTGMQPPVPRVSHQGQPMRAVKGPQPPVPREPSALRHHSQPMHPVEPGVQPGAVSNLRRGAQQESNNYNILVTSASTDKFIGFIAKEYNADNLQRYGVTPDVEQAISVAPGILDNISPKSLIITNPSDTYAQLAFVTGPAASGNSLTQGSHSYALLTGAKASDIGASPARFENAYGNGDVKSGVWALNTESRIVSVAWINPGGTPVEATLVYLPRDNALALTGDFEEFSKAFGDAIPVSFTLV